MRLRDMSRGALLRLTLCLLMLHGWASATAEEAGGRFGEGEPGEVQQVPYLTEQASGVTGAGIVANREDGNVEVDGGNLAMAAEREGGATVPAIERAPASVSATAEESAPVGECSGRRFKKCR